MEELMDLIATDESPSQVSDKIKDLLFGKSAEKIEGLRSVVASSMFDNDNDDENEEEVDFEVEDDEEENEE